MYVESEAGGGQSPSLAVSPDQLLPLANGIEVERERLQNWIFENELTLTEIDPPGNDPCSKDTVAVFMHSGREAVKHAQAYVEQLKHLVAELRATAKEYGLAEDDNTNSFRRGIE